MDDDRTETALEAMKTALLRSGYLLEQRVRPVVEQHGYYVQGNAAYPDELTGKSRELDIYAINARAAGPGDVDFIFHVILGECVNNSQPLVFFSHDTYIGFLNHYEEKFSGLPTQLLDKDGS